MKTNSLSALNFLPPTPSLPPFRERLITLWNSSFCHNFYLVMAPLIAANPNQFLEQWMLEFILNILPRAKKNTTNLEEISHPDIMFFSKNFHLKKGNSKDKEEKQFSKLLTFLNFNALELPRKIVIISNGNAISEITFNKLLKTLEDPSDETNNIKNETIFFMLVPNDKSLPQTLLSRAIRIRPSISEISLPSLPIDEEKQFLQDFIKSDKDNTKKIEEGKIWEWLKMDPENKSILFKLLLDEERNQDSSFEQKDAFLISLQHYSRSTTFHNPSPGCFYPLLHTH